MPTYARKQIIEESEVRVYHCYTRCNYQEFWLGPDGKANANFSHRKQWILDRVKELSKGFAIDVGKLAILDNHLHTMLRNRPDIVAKWSDAHVITRARQCFPSYFEKRGVGRNSRKIPKKIAKDKKLIAEMRARLSSISWFMRQLLNYVSRRANEELGKTGHFFSDRFKSQWLEDDFAILSCAVYIDCNELRAGIVDRPEKAMNSSIGIRIAALKARRARRKAQARDLDGFLAPVNLEGDHKMYDAAKLQLRASNRGFLEMPLSRYIEIVDLAGRLKREGARGRIPAELGPILERLGLTAEALADIAENFKNCRSIVAAPDRLVQIAQEQGKRTIQGLSYLRSLFQSSRQATSST